MSTSHPISQDPIARLAEEQTWLTPQAETTAQDVINRILNGIWPKNPQAFRELLHGTWAHEPLHSVMTDVPIGSWTAALLFDGIGAVSGNKTMNTAADALVVLGLVSATGAAVLGMNDWAEVKREAPRKIGAMHALLNVAATGLYAASLFERRKKGSRSAARIWGTLGYLTVSLSSHLGGNMIYEHGIGVQRGKAWQD